MFFNKIRGIFGLIPVFFVCFAVPALASGGEHSELGNHLPLIAIIPFVGLLLSIAILPLYKPRWWHHNRNQGLVALGWSMPILIYFLIFLHEYTPLIHSLEEYIAFIALLGSLFTISGGISLTGDLKASPKINTLFLAIGAVLANVIGTTGASMILIRPMLQTNKERERIRHIPLFFIFIVSNIGGTLTPLGDPPLFLGFLRGVPFFWTLKLFPQWALMIVMLLAVFYIYDRSQYKKESIADIECDNTHIEPIKITGRWNFLLLGGVILSVLFSHYLGYVREAIMLALSIISYYITPKEAHKSNDFNFYPIKEVALLFAGIFITMIPALLILQARGGGLGINEPWQFFWMTGILSSFLDNAPTYLTFTSLASGVFNLAPDASLLDLITHSPEAELLLKAISLGAVFMGANSYIGNAPNFMVKSISEQNDVKMPSFFGYMLYSVVILVPFFIIITLILQFLM